MSFENDPIGLAIHDFQKDDFDPDIIVKSDLCEDDVLPVSYLFRTFEQMPDIEKFALSLCDGKVLDIGAGAGCHAKHLKDQGIEVVALERSAGAHEYLISTGISSKKINFMDFKEEKFDTILLLMNGIGLAGSLENLPSVLGHLKTLLKPHGKILCDSTDIEYMYTNEDGSKWLDLNSAYKGEMQFNMMYKTSESGWFPWLYIDQLKFTEFATEAGFEIEILLEGENNHYLAELKID